MRLLDAPQAAPVGDMGDLLPLAAARREAQSAGAVSGSSGGLVRAVGGATLDGGVSVKGNVLVRSDARGAALTVVDRQLERRLAGDVRARDGTAHRGKVVVALQTSLRPQQRVLVGNLRSLGSDGCNQGRHDGKELHLGSLSTEDKHQSVRIARRLR